MTVQDRLLGAPEWRGIDDYEVRKSSDGHEFIVRGYASLFNTEYPVAGGPELGGWVESVDRRAFDVTLAAKPDVHFLINHAGKSLARTKSGTLKLSADSTGLMSEARIDRRTQDGRDLEISMERGDLDEMSFAFRTIRHDWPTETSRVLLEVSIDKGDVSVVNNGANDATRIRIAKDALEAIRSYEVAEVRSALDNPVAALEEARSHINRLLAELVPSGARPLSIEEALREIGG